MTNQLTNWKNFRKQIKLDPVIAQILVGVSKREIKRKLGAQFNDIKSNVWVYRVSSRFTLTNHKFLYIYFDDNNLVTSTKVRQSKVSLK